MTKTEFTAFLAEKYNVDYASAEKVLNAFLDSLEDAMYKDGRIVLPGFGVLQRRERAARSGRNPATGETIAIPPSRTIVFKPAAVLKELLAGNSCTA